MQYPCISYISIKTAKLAIMVNGENDQFFTSLCVFYNVTSQLLLCLAWVYLLDSSVMTLSDKPDLTTDLRANVMHTESLKAFGHLSSSLFLFRDSHVTLGKESTCQWRRRVFDPWVRKILLRRKQQPTPGFLAGKSLDRGAGRLQPMGLQKSDTTEQLNNNSFCSWLTWTARRGTQPN